MALQRWRENFEFITDESGVLRVLPVLPSLADDPEDPPDGAIWRNSSLAATRQVRHFDGSTVRDLEVRAEKDAASGYAGLDANGYLTASTLGALNLDRVWRSPLPCIGNFNPTIGTAYAVYIKRTVGAATPKHIEFHVPAAGSGAQTGEVGWFSSTSAPNKAGKTLTKIVVDGTLDALTGTGMKRNTSANATAIPDGTYIWLVIRLAMATTNPTLAGLARDQSQGYVLELAGASALSSYTNDLAMTVPALAASPATAIGPDIRAVFD